MSGAEQWTAIVLLAMEQLGEWPTFNAFMADRPHEVVPQIVAHVNASLDARPVADSPAFRLTESSVFTLLWNADRSGMFRSSDVERAAKEGK